MDGRESVLHSQMQLFASQLENMQLQARSCSMVWKMDITWLSRLALQLVLMSLRCLTTLKLFEFHEAPLIADLPTRS